MKIAVVFALIGIALALPNQLHMDATPQSLAGIKDDSFSTFQMFIQAYDRLYASEDEMMYRYGVFRQAQAEARKFQQSERGTAVYGINQFSDRLLDEVITPFSAATKLSAAKAAPTQFDKYVRGRVYDVPADIDHRELGHVTDVKNQGQCGSCWAFATIATIEGTSVTQGGLPLTRLSEDQLVLCDKKSGGCRGGWMHWAIDYLTSEDRVDEGHVGDVYTEESWPYKHRGKCPKKNKYEDKVVGSHVSGKKIYCANSEYVEPEIFTQDPCTSEQMKVALAEYGPVSMALNAAPMVRYSSGIMDQDDDDCDPTRLSHGVAYVGYSTSTDEGSFFIVKNSWGSRWGEDGYCRIMMRDSGKGVCGSLTVVVAATH